MNKRIQTAHVFVMCFNVFDLVDTPFTVLVFLAWILYLDIALSCFSIQIYKDSKISKSYCMYTQQGLASPCITRFPLNNMVSTHVSGGILHQLNLQYSPTTGFLPNALFSRNQNAGNRCILIKKDLRRWDIYQNSKLRQSHNGIFA